MSLRVLIQTQHIRQWLADRQGTPARRRGTENEFAIWFDPPPPEFEPLTPEEFVAAMRLNHQVLLVDDEPGKTYYRFVPRG